MKGIERFTYWLLEYFINHFGERFSGYGYVDDSGKDGYIEGIIDKKKFKISCCSRTNSIYLKSRYLYKDIFKEIEDELLTFDFVKSGISFSDANDDVIRENFSLSINLDNYELLEANNIKVIQKNYIS